MCAIEGLAPSEAAHVLGIPAGTVRSRLHAARKQLLEILSS
jgi:DNA-directed RNA polymerase specialized sigma24 family protein